MLAERIATLGGSPVGTMGANVDHSSWDGYSLGRDTAQAHLGALDKVYDGMIGNHHKPIAVAGVALSGQPSVTTVAVQLQSSDTDMVTSILLWVAREYGHI